MTSRCRCLVPFCRRSRGPRKGDDPPITETTEWVCADHWKAVPKSLKRRRSRIVRMMGRASGERLHRLDAIDRKLWERCKTAAIERAAGL